MSVYINILNKIKTNCNRSWLTDAEMRTFTQLSEKLGSSQLVNLFGDHGTGKTFVTWILSKEGGGAYISSPTYYDTIQHHTVILDNFSDCSRNTLRELMGKYALNGVRKFIIITIVPFKKEQCVEISTEVPTKIDIDKMRNNLKSIAEFVKITNNGINYWDILKNLGGAKNA